MKKPQPSSSSGSDSGGALRPGRRVGQAAGEAHNNAEDPAYLFRFGLARVLDGIETLVSERQQ